MKETEGNMQERGEKKKEGERKRKGKGRLRGRDTGERHRRRNIREAKERHKEEQTEGNRQMGTDREKRRRGGDRGEETEG